MNRKWTAVMMAALMGMSIGLTGCGGRSVTHDSNSQQEDIGQTITLDETPSGESAGNEGTFGRDSDRGITDNLQGASASDVPAIADTTAAVEEVSAGNIENKLETSVPDGDNLMMGGLSFPTGGMARLHDPEAVEKVSSEEASRMERSMRAYTPPAESLLINVAENYYYYEQLDSEEQAVYDALLMLAEDPVSEDNYNVYLSSVDPSSEECLSNIARAYFALIFDHPELFWLYNSCKASIGMGSDGSVVAGKYPVYLYFGETFPEFEKMQSDFNDAAEDFLKDIDLTGSDREIALAIHDKLIELVTYDTDVLEGGEEKADDLAHTAYGALVANSDGTQNYAVCDGYSLAYVYLLQQAGLDAILIGGEAGADKESAGGHAWSMVKIDDNWYEVDSTWDDMGTLDDQITPDIEGYQYYLEALSDVEYRSLLEHQFFEITTEQLSDYMPDIERLSYTTKDGEYELMLAEKSIHIRDDESIGPSGEVISTAPIAK